MNARQTSDHSAQRADTVVSDDLAQKFKTEKDTPYLRWVRGEGLDMLSSHYVRNLRTVELKPWARRGGQAVFLNHDASRTGNDCYVCEIPPAGKLNPHRQLFEEMIFILDGRGSTTVWNDAGARVTFEWKAALDLRHSAQLLASALQRFRPGAGALRGGDQRPGGDQSLRGHRFRLRP